MTQQHISPRSSATTTAPTTWLLEVVRGSGAGTRIALKAGRTVLGRRPGEAGLDLSTHDPSPAQTSRLGASHAAVILEGEQIRIEDLESPSGTFVNRRRILPGTTPTLQDGDLIALGGVQVRLVLGAADGGTPKPIETPTASPPKPATPRTTSRPSTPPQATPALSAPSTAGRPRPTTTPTPTRTRSTPTTPTTSTPSRATSGASTPSTRPKASPPSPISTSTPGSRSRPQRAAGSFHFAIGSGVGVCRTWDDFLTISAQDWSALRDELTSGRLARFLAEIGRSDLLPAPGSRRDEDADQRLDAWLKRLPTTKASDPELEVHPPRLVVRVRAGGGQLARRVRLLNVGYRILQASVRLEPSGLDWVALEHRPGVPLQAIEESEVAIKFTVPEPFTVTQAATLVVESNGGNARVPVLLEPIRSDPLDPALMADGSDPVPSIGWSLHEALAGLSIRGRLLAATASATGLRVLFAVGDRLAPPESTVLAPGLLGAVGLLALIGLVLGFALARRGGHRGDALWCAGLGAILSLGLAALGHALAHAIEVIPEPVSGLPLMALGTWAVLGGVSALISIAMVPPHASNPTSVDKSSIPSSQASRPRP